MERMTTRHNGHPALVQGYKERFTETSLFFMLLNRLAAYEDTGLEPEEIKELCTDEVAEIAKLFRHMIEYGSIDHLRELLNAEKDGRLVVLPCKVGSILYAITSPVNVYELESAEAVDIFECAVESVTFYSNGNAQFRLYYHGVFVASFVTVDDFGKTVFLTRQEAEAALKKREEDT